MLGIDPISQITCTSIFSFIKVTGALNTSISELDISKLSNWFEKLIPPRQLISYAEYTIPTNALTCEVQKTMKTPSNRPKTLHNKLQT